MTGTHYLSMIVIGVGSFVFGILPTAFSFRARTSYPFFLSLILCLGAGVLLGTSLVHMLTEVQEQLKLYAQLYYCVGFLCLYTFDEISCYCLGIKKLQIDLVNSESRKRNTYGATEHSVKFCENSPFPGYDQNKHCSGADDTVSCDKYFECCHSYSKCNLKSQQNLIDHYSHSSSSQHETVDRSNEEEQWSANPATKTGLLLGLLIHSILEGVSIGVQTKNSQIFLILGAVTFHKIVLSFCLGVELHNHGYNKSHLLLAIFLFSIGSPLGILLGTSVTTFENGSSAVDAKLQAVAAGSILYVALLEVLPRERSKWKKVKKGAGIFQLIFFLIGFSCITGFHFLFN